MLHGIDFSRNNVALKIVPWNITLSETSQAWARCPADPIIWVKMTSKQDAPLTQSFGSRWPASKMTHWSKMIRWTHPFRRTGVLRRMSLCVLRSGKHLRGWLWRWFSAQGVQEENISIHFLTIASAWTRQLWKLKGLGMTICVMARQTDNCANKQACNWRETLMRKRITNDDRMHGAKHRYNLRRGNTIELVGIIEHTLGHVTAVYFYRDFALINPPYWIYLYCSKRKKSSNFLHKLFSNKKLSSKGLFAWARLARITGLTCLIRILLWL